MGAGLNRLVVWTALAAMLAAWPSIAAAQLGPLTPPAAPAAPAVEDPLKRETPKDAFLGFVSAAQAGNYALAAQYLQWPRARLGISKEDAAAQLMFALNHGFEGNLERLSRQPEGLLTDGLTPDRERAGVLVLADGERVDVLLARVAEGFPTPVWLVAADTVADIPRLHDRSGLPELERRLPRSLTEAQFGGLPVWVPLALLALLPIIYLAVRLVLGCGAWLVRVVSRLRHQGGPAWFWAAWAALSRPTAFLLTVFLHGIVGGRIGIPIYHRYLFSRTVTILFLAGTIWWLWRLQDLLASRIQAYLERTNPGRAQSVYIMGRRVLKGLMVGIAVLIALAAFGVDLSATLAGLGIGGLALAFAAQKTLENVFGGISVLGDKSIVVGDYCKIGPHTGTVEDVGLRTTKLRTLARTVVHVPNGSLATMEVENFGRRDKFLLQTTLTLRYETTPDQLAGAIDALRAILADDARVEPETRRVRFIRFGAYSLDVEVFAYVLALDYAGFLEVQEDLLFRMMRAVADAGTGFAFPSQTLYLNRDDAGRPGTA
jgi:MscS family membrane protein